MRIKQRSIFLYIVALLLSIVTDYYVGAVKSIETTADCNACFENKDIVCRSRFDPSTSYCCDSQSQALSCTTDPDEPDFDKKINGRNYDLCSHELPNSLIEMRAYTCPYRP